eukprot:14175988-Alexandrium_andersonii.AAC.1
MSASLVGSEMCIRDRARGAPRQVRCRSHSGAGARRLRPRPWRRWRSTSPVSYTHLTLPTICSV